MGIRRVSPSKLVEDIYKRGRSYREFVGYEGETQKAIPVLEKWELDPKGNSPTPQRREDAQAPGYDNNTKEGWLVGRGAPHPHFGATPKFKKPY
jgi:hypothetical protein